MKVRYTEVREGNSPEKKVVGLSYLVKKSEKEAKQRPGVYKINSETLCDCLGAEWWASQKKKRVERIKHPHTLYEWPKAHDPVLQIITTRATET